MYLEIGRMIWIASDGSRGVRWIAKIGIRFLALPNLKDHTTKFDVHNYDEDGAY
jgi:hypothetical protein